MGDTIWLRGENGVLFTLDQAAVTDHWYRRIQVRELTQVSADGSPWTGAPVSPPQPKNTYWSGGIIGSDPKLVTPAGDPADVVPELTLDTLRGYRSWADHESGTWLLRSHERFPWPPGEWAQARCRACETAERPVPSWGACRTYGYGCGLYAASTPAIGVRGKVWGVLEAKGRIVSHPDGFRAQYARPVALAVPEGSSYRGVAGEWPKIVREIARVYGIPVLPAEQLVAEYPPDTG